MKIHLSSAWPRCFFQTHRRNKSQFGIYYHHVCSFFGFCCTKCGFLFEWFVWPFTSWHGISIEMSTIINNSSTSLVNVSLFFILPFLKIDTNTLHMIQTQISHTFHQISPFNKNPKGFKASTSRHPLSSLARLQSPAFRVWVENMLPCWLPWDLKPWVTLGVSKKTHRPPDPFWLGREIFVIYILLDGI